MRRWAEAAGAARLAGETEAEGLWEGVAMGLLGRL